MVKIQKMHLIEKGFSEILNKIGHERMKTLIILLISFTLILRRNPEKRASFSIDLSPYDYGQWMAPQDNRRWNDEW